MPVELPFLPFDGERVVDLDRGALASTAVPEHLVVVGAGAIGLELGSVWSRLGAKVTVVEMLPTDRALRRRADGQDAAARARSQGLDFRLSTKVTAAKVDEEGVTVTVANDKGETEELRCDRVLVAVGRRPDTRARASRRSASSSRRAAG